MKKNNMFILTALALGTFSGCTGGINVKNPPQFVEMYVDEDASPIVSTLQPKSMFTTFKYSENDDDKAIYSHEDFFIVVVTNGTNYDLLYSVELEDSLLGTCIYTDQSLTYKANATINVESDNSYTTEISLTIPGSTSHTSYLSERIITLTKILFSRDTVDGTFPADIPSNADTILNFEIHAVNYFDSDLGYPVIINEGYIDINLKVGTSEYTATKNNEKPDLIFPASINGYQVRSLYLESLDWITSLTIEGAFEHIYIVGNYDLLEILSISNIEHTITIINPTYKELAITGHFPVLESLILDDCHGYNIYLKHYLASVNDDYNNHLTSVVGIPYSFPTLENIEITSCSLHEIYIGGDTHGVSFPLLTTVSFLQTSIGNLYFGNELNEFASLLTIEANDCHFSNMSIAGFKDVELPPATIHLQSGNYGFFELVGDAVGVIDADEVTFDGILINSRSTRPSRLSNLQLDQVTLNGMTDSLRLNGDFSLLETISLTDFEGGQILVGNATSKFPLLTSISLDNITAASLQIGDRDCEFDALTDITIDQSIFTDSIVIGYENSKYKVLSTITISEVTASSIMIGRNDDTFLALELIYLENVTLTDTFEIKSISAVDLDTIVLINVTMDSLSVAVILASYNIYIDNVTITATIYISDTCLAIYVPEDPSSTWIYYEDATALGIPVITGTYSPPM
jgi:hypothetical protein